MRTVWILTDGKGFGRFGWGPRYQESFLWGDRGESGFRIIFVKNCVVRLGNIVQSRASAGGLLRVLEALSDAFGSIDCQPAHPDLATALTASLRIGIVLRRCSNGICGRSCCGLKLRHGTRMFRSV